MPPTDVAPLGPPLGTEITFREYETIGTYLGLQLTWQQISTMMPHLGSATHIARVYSYLGNCKAIKLGYDVLLRTNNFSVELTAGELGQDSMVLVRQWLEFLEKGGVATGADRLLLFRIIQLIRIGLLDETLSF